MIMTMTQLRPGTIIEVTPERLVAGGDSLSRAEGLPIFVPGIFPGDRARVEITEAKKGFARGRFLEVLEAGPLRRAEPCPVAGTCGGCDWTALRLDHQLRWKKEILRETLRRVGKFDLDSLPDIPVHSSPLNYRLRSRLQYDAQRDLLGFFGMRTHEVVEISEQCEVVGPETLRSIAELQALARETSADAVSVFEEDQTLHAHALFGDGEKEHVPVEIEVAGFRYSTSTAAFFQVNRHMLSLLCDLVSAEAGKCRERGSALDLYGGVGFFAVPLSRLFGRVVSVEGSPLGHRHAQQNFARLPNAEAVLSSTERFAERSRERFDLVMLDPPRAGAAPGVMESVDRLAGERVCYLSCDPVTFARDASRLTRRGWSISSLHLIDLFPNTHHIELFSSFVREGTRQE
jgi:tRNA/tmRNA/rRNA uracil-C5-methylase (TrmA/RlmC/RlmD family)